MPRFASPHFINVLNVSRAFVEVFGYALVGSRADNRLFRVERYADFSESYAKLLEGPSRAVLATTDDFDVIHVSKVCPGIPIVEECGIDRVHVHISEK